MFLNTTSTTHPAPGSLGPRRTPGAVASSAAAMLAEQARRIRAGHLSFVLGLTVAVAAVVSLGALEADTSPRLQARAPEIINGIDVSWIPAAPVYIVLVDSQDEANQLLAETYHLQTEASGSVSLPTIRVIGSAEDDQHLQDELSTMTYHGVAYRIKDLQAK
jgi:hypothetical protein